MIETRRQSEPLVTVFRGGEPGSLGLARSLLDDAGIRYLVQGDLIADFFRMGRIGPLGYNLITGPVRLVVAAEDADVARELLGNLNPWSGRPVWPVVRYIATLMLLGSLAGLLGTLCELVRGFMFSPR